MSNKNTLTNSIRYHINLIEAFGRKTPLDQYKPDLLKIATKQYNDWDEEDTDTYAGGGICHFIADDWSEYFQNKGYLATSISATHMQHVYTVVVITKDPEDGEITDEFYEVDIDPYRYETGGGFSWCKRPDVTLDINDIAITYLGVGEDWYRNFDLDYELEERKNELGL